MDNNEFNAMMDGQEQVVFWQSVGVYTTALGLEVGLSDVEYKEKNIE